MKGNYQEDTGIYINCGFGEIVQRKLCSSQLLCVSLTIRMKPKVYKAEVDGTKIFSYYMVFSLSRGWGGKGISLFIFLFSALLPFFHSPSKISVKKMA